MPRRVLQGTVVSDKMNKTVTVLVERRVMHAKYKKYVKKSSKHAAHDEANVCQVGDSVAIEECRPISKNKSWKVISGTSPKGEARVIAPFAPAERVKAPVAKPAAKPAAKKATAKATAPKTDAKAKAPAKPKKAKAE